jgi:hypothetical protein
MSTDSLSRLPARPLTAILEALVTMAPAERPHVTLLLESGHSVTGALLAFANEHGERTALLHNTDGHGAYDLTYLPLRSLHALKVHLIGENLHALSFGALRKPLAKVPSRLENSRALQALLDQLAPMLEHEMSGAIAWDGLPASDDALSGVAVLVDDLRGALSAVCSDPMGRDALRAKLRRIEVAAGESPGVALRDGVLVLAVALAGGDVRALGRAELRSAIEGLL